MISILYVVALQSEAIEWKAPKNENRSRFSLKFLLPEY